MTLGPAKLARLSMRTRGSREGELRVSNAVVDSITH